MNTRRIIEAMDEGLEELTHSLAADFVENEVGRHDFLKNWPQWKARQDPVAAVQAWLSKLPIPVESPVTAHGIVAEIERVYALGRPWHG